MNSKLIFITLSLMFACANAERMIQGPCPSYEAMTTFNATRYLGVWYEFFRYDAGTANMADCVSSNYTLNNSTYEVKNVLKVLPDKKEIIKLGHAHMVNATNPMEAKIKITFNNSTQENEYWVLSTDYISYSTVWNCVALNNTHSVENVWVLMRNQTIEAKNLNLTTMADVIKYVNVTSLRSTEQNTEKCGYNGSGAGTIVPSILSLLIVTIASFSKL